MIQGINKAKFVQKLAKRLDVTIATANTAWEGVCELIFEELSAGRPVKVERVGTLHAQERKARAGMNAFKNERTFFPARMLVKFKPMEGMKESVGKLPCGTTTKEG